MIESFSEFNKRTPQNLFEEASLPQVGDSYEDGVVLDSIDQEELEKSEKPDIKMVSDSKILSKMTMYVIKVLRKSIKTENFLVNPYLLEIDGKECSMIYSLSKTMFFVIYREGINKVVTYFKENPVGVGDVKSELSVSTSKFGITQAIQTLIDIFELNNDGKLNEEVAPPKDDPHIAWPTIYKKLYDGEDRVVQSFMAQFIKLYNSYTPAQIYSNYLCNPDVTDEYIENIRFALTGKTDAASLSEATARRFAIAIHLLICGLTGVADAITAAKLKKLWFFGAGKSGEIAIDSAEGVGYFVKEAQNLIDEKVDELQRKMDSVTKSAQGICKYIKSNGKDEVDMRRAMGLYRGLLITGVAGVGKTYSLKKEYRKLAKNVDYIEVGNKTTSAREVYKDLCQHNNMLLIYDDTPDMFNTEQKISLWKGALEYEEQDRCIVCPDGDARGNSSIYYPTRDPGFTRQDQYYREIGKFTTQEKEEWIEKRKKELRKYHLEKRKVERDYMDLEFIEKYIKIKAQEDFKKHEKNEAETLLPDSFIFNGIIVYISNKSLSGFRKDVGDHWGAIKRRMKAIDISPTRKVVWYWLRRKIVEDMNNESIPNDLKILPVESEIPGYNLNEILKYIDDIVEGKYNNDVEIYGEINWGTIKNFREYLFYGQEEWKESILQDMRIDAIREK